MYWVELTNKMLYENWNVLNGVTNPTPYYKGFLNFTRQQPAPNDNAEITSLNFFELPACYFVWFNNGSYYPEVDGCGFGTSIVPVVEDTVPDADVPLWTIWIPADSLAKSLYYTVLADLGQNTTSYINILTDPNLLSYFTQNFTNIPSVISSTKQDGQTVELDQALALKPFSQSSPGTGPLEITVSTLVTNYLCQVPRLKSAGSLVVSVLVADLVLLQAIWQLFKWSVDFTLLNRNPEMEYCAGCAGIGRVKTM